MAGHYVLTSISQSELINTLYSNQIFLSDTQHRRGEPVNPKNNRSPLFKGWCVETRQTLEKALNNQTIQDRENIPPHNYIHIECWSKLNENAKSRIRNADWTDRLKVLSGPGFRSKPLSDISSHEFNKNNKSLSLIEQLKQGSVSVEIYYFSGTEA